MFCKNLFSQKKEEVWSSFSVKPAKFKRLAIYAAYNPDGYIDASDLNYLKALTEVADNIIYVADNALRTGEENKIKNLVCHIEAHRHNEYDFGSYKCGYLYALSHNLLDNIDELIFCNSSCYTPVHPFNNMFNTMNKRACDFWGITQNEDISLHIQSFFLVFRPDVFNSAIFRQFINNIVKQPCVEEVIHQYEVGLSRLLFNAGYKGDSYIAYPDRNSYPRTKCVNNLTAVPVWLMQQGAPVLKKKAFTQKLANLDGLLLTRRTAIRYNPSLRYCLPVPFKCLILKMLDFIYKKKITKSGNLLIKFCRIPVYHRMYHPCNLHKKSLG